MTQNPTADPRYPTPDRSDFTPNQYVHDQTLPEGDLGARALVLTDGRPARVESWFSHGATYITLFFSTLDLEDAPPDRLSALVAPVLEEENVLPRWRELSAAGVKTIVDASGNPIFSLTFVVREPEL